MSLTSYRAAPPRFGFLDHSPFVINLSLLVSDGVIGYIAPTMYLHKNAHGGRWRHKVEILSEQQNHRCCYCGIRFVDGPENHPHTASIEHVIRLVDGGAREWSNEVAACRWCNSSRGAVDAEMFFAARPGLPNPPYQPGFYRHRRRKHGRKNRHRVRVWQSQIAMVGHDVALGTFKEVWPRIEARAG